MSLLQPPPQMQQGADQIFAHRAIGYAEPARDFIGAQAIEPAQQERGAIAYRQLRERIESERRILRRRERGLGRRLEVEIEEIVFAVLERAATADTVDRE